MKILFNIALFLSVLSFKAQQNLVHNWDFELYSQCPTAVAQMNFCTNWGSANFATPDYYNACATYTTNAGVPFNAGGYQIALSGNAYCGIFVFLLGADGHFREYIQGKLLSPLIAGHSYQVEINVSLYNASSYAISKFGVFFSASTVLQTNTKPLNNIPQVALSNGTFITDTINWTSLSGNYIANGTENYITLGNFTDTLINDTISVLPVDTGGPDYSSYYYFDDIKLIDITASSVSEITVSNIFTPNADGINDLLDFDARNIETWDLRIYDRWGLNVFETKSPNNNWDGRTTAGKQCVDGTYYYLLTARGLDGVKYNYKGFIQLIH